MFTFAFLTYCYIPKIFCKLIMQNTFSYEYEMLFGTLWRNI